MQAFTVRKWINIIDFGKQEIRNISSAAMLTKRSRSVFSWRQRLSVLGYFGPFEWNVKNQSLGLSSGWRFRLWPFNHVYLVLYDSYILVNVMSYVWTWNEIVDFDKLQFTTDIFFVNMMSLLAIAQFLVLGSRLEFVQLTNHILQLDEHLEGTVKPGLLVLVTFL